MANNIDPDDLDLLAKSFSQQKPKIEGDLSLNEAQRAIHFGKPDNSLKPDKSDQKPQKQIKIQINSPQLAKNTRPTAEKKPLLQHSQAGQTIEKNNSISSDIGFIPYGISYITTKQALNYILKDRHNFEIIQQNYLSIDNLQFIISRIQKIQDLSQTSKNTIIEFYRKILDRKKLIQTAQQKAAEILTKIKTKQFRTSISNEIQRMMKNSGDLYQYYANTNLLEEDIKKRFLAVISGIDYYIIKKIKELLIFRQIDVIYRYREVIDFSKIIKSRNILMENFHAQLNQLQTQKNQIEKLKSLIEDSDKNLQQIATSYGRSGQYGRKIAASSNLTNQIKNTYFQNIAKLLEPYLGKIQKLKLDLDTGNFSDIKQLNSNYSQINLDKIKQQLKQEYEKLINKKI